jgi:hypothetical protein
VVLRQFPVWEIVQQYVNLGVDDALPLQQADCRVCEWFWGLTCRGGGYVLCKKLVEDEVAGTVACGVLQRLVSCKFALWGRNEAYMKTCSQYKASLDEVRLHGKSRQAHLSRELGLGEYVLLGQALEWEMIPGQIVKCTGGPLMLAADCEVLHGDSRPRVSMKP